MTKIFYAIKEIMSDWIFQILFIVNIIGILQQFITNFKIDLKYLLLIFVIGIVFSSIRIIVNKNIKINNLKNKNVDPDIILFKKITEEILPKDETAYFLKHHHFGTSFNYSNKKNLDNFVGLCVDRSDFFFRNKNIEKAKKNLEESIIKFLDFAFAEIFMDENQERMSVPTEWKYSHDREIENRYYKSVEKLNDLSLEISDKYSKFLEIGSKKLSLPFKE